MNKIIKGLLVLTLMTISLPAICQELKLMSFDEFSKYISDDKSRVVNFWATWCKPCVAELPYFEKANDRFHSENFELILVNLDFNSKTETLVKPFMKNKKLHATVIHITDTDPNLWINRVDSSWSGAIPATVMYRGKEKVFFKEGEMKEDELMQIISDKLIKNNTIK